MCFPRRKKKTPQITAETIDPLAIEPKDSWTVVSHLMELLSELLVVCREHGWRPYLDFGTLLGCIRTGVMVPWDYDVDISFLESDYVQFVAYFKSLPKQTLGNMRFDTLSHYTKNDEATCRIFHANTSVRYQWTFDTSFQTGIDIIAVKEYPEKGEVGTMMQPATYARWRGCYSHPTQVVLPLKQALFMGEPCWIPNNPEEVLRRNYGDSWRKPDVTSDKVEQYGILRDPLYKVLSWSPETGTKQIYWAIRKSVGEVCGLTQQQWEEAANLGQLVSWSKFKIWGKVFVSDVEPQTLDGKAEELWVKKAVFHDENSVPPAASSQES
jgi:hypothetical protein